MRDGPKCPGRSCCGPSFRALIPGVLSGVIVLLLVSISLLDAGHGPSPRDVGVVSSDDGERSNSSTFPASASHESHPFSRAATGLPASAVPGPHSQNWIYRGFGPQQLMGSSLEHWQNGWLVFGGSGPGPSVTYDNITYVGGPRSCEYCWAYEAWPPNWTGRAQAATAYFPPLQGYVMFGGRTNSGAIGDTWVFNYWGDSLPPPSGGEWEWYSANVSGPAPRWDASIAYDPAIHDLVLFGGTNGSADSNDTWLFGPTSWSRVFPPTSPSPRSGAALAWDSSLGGLILFGGQDMASNTPLNDTWEFANGTWTLLQPAHAPPGRFDASATGYRGIALLTGGSNSEGGTFDDTWEYQNGSWTSLPVVLTSGGLYQAAIATDQSGMVWLFGGWGSCGDGSTGVCDTMEELDQLALSVHPTPIIYVNHPWYAFANATWGIGNYTFTWRFPNGSSYTGSSVDATFASQPGTYTIQVNVTDSAGVINQTDVEVEVLPPFNVQPLKSSVPEADVGQSVDFTEIASGGGGTYGYSWSGLPPNCSARGQTDIHCELASPGSYSILAEVVDNATDDQVWHQLPFNVSQDPRILGFNASPPSVTEGQELRLTVNVTDGSLPLTYTFGGLPRGCDSDNSSVLVCWPNGTGHFVVEIEVSDATGYTVSKTLLINVSASGPGSNPGGFEYPLLVSGIVAAAMGTAFGVLIWSRRRRARFR